MQFSAEEVGHVDEVLDVPVPACPSFGELDFVVDALEGAVGQVRIEEAHDPAPVRLDGFREL